MSSKITKIDRDIAPGEVFTHTGPVELNGSVGKGAKIEIDEGGIHVKGALADDVSIRTRGPDGGSVSGGTFISGGNIVITGNVTGVVIRNGKVISGNVSGGGDLSGIEVDGTTGSRVRLDTDVSVVLKAAAGDDLHVKGGTSVTLKDTGDRLEGESGNSFTAGSVGANSEIDGGNSVTLGELGDFSSSISGNSTNIGKIGAKCKVRAGNSANIGSIGAGSALKTGNSANVGTAHDSANVSAGNKANISRRSGNDAEFRLSRSFAAAAQPATAAQTPASPEAGDGVQAMKPLQFRKPGEEEQPPAGPKKLKFNL